MGDLCYLVKLVTNLHIHLNTPMSKTTLANVCRLLENFKNIKIVYSENLDFFIDSVFIVCQHLSYQALSIIQLTMVRFFFLSIFKASKIFCITEKIQYTINVHIVQWTWYWYFVSLATERTMHVWTINGCSYSRHSFDAQHFGSNENIFRRTFG